jgi:thiopurine S-methyltransferase
MEQEFWAERWSLGETNFHEPKVNRNLTNHVEAWGLSADSVVLVPLCGKTVDLIWLARRARRVVGVELIEAAIQEFLADNSLVAEREDVAGEAEQTEAIRYTASVPADNDGPDGVVELICGDFLALGRPGSALDASAGITHVWDRAALVALPPEMRQIYAPTLQRLAPGAKMLLNSFQYDQSVMDGPPFSVDGDEVQRLFGQHRIELLDRVDVIERAPRFKDMGHPYWFSTVNLIQL